MAFSSLCLEVSFSSETLQVDPRALLFLAFCLWPLVYWRSKGMALTQALTVTIQYGALELINVTLVSASRVVVTPLVSSRLKVLGWL